MDVIPIFYDFLESTERMRNLKDFSVVHSDVTGKDYRPSQAVRIVNLLQAAAYIHSGELPLDVYTSIDFKTSKPILVFIFDRESSKPLYDLWCKHELTWED